MIFFFAPSVFIFILYFNEIEEASGMFRKIFPKTAEKDKERMDSDGYHCDHPGTSHQQSSTEISDVVKQFKFRNGLPPQFFSTSSMIRNDQIQHGIPEYRKGYSEQENIEWLLETCRHGPLPLPELKLPASEGTKMKETEEEREARKELDEKMSEAKRLYALPISEHSKLIQLRPFEDHQPLNDEKIMKEMDALRLYGKYYSADFLPKPQPDDSSEIAPPALHEMDRSMTKGGYRRKERKNRKPAVRKNV